MLTRVALVAVVACASLTACSRGADEPRPTTTLEPSIIESSTMPTTSPRNRACALLSKEDRASLPGYSMDDIVPTAAAAGTEECVWVHSRREFIRSAIRLVAVSAREWAPNALTAVDDAMRDPKTTRSDRRKLKTARSELIVGASSLPAKRICEIYILALSARGFARADDRVYFGYIGPMLAGYAVTCKYGVAVTAGYGEYGLRPSLAVLRAAARLAAKAVDRAPEVFAEDADDASATSDEPSAEPTNQAGDEPSASPQPEAATDSDDGSTDTSDS